MGYWVQRTALILLIVWISGLTFLRCRSEEEKLPYYNSPAFDPLFISDESEVEANVTHRIANFALVNQRNENVTANTVSGRIHVANFFFTTCPSICPRMTSHMKKISDTYSADSSVVLLSYSVTPWIDDVARLKEYAALNEINSVQWHLLTGKKSDIYQLARQSYFAEEAIGFTKDSTEFLHTEHFILVDPSLRIRGIYNGTLELEIEQLIKDIRTLKEE